MDPRPLGDAMNNMNDQDLISALADGQLRGEAFARGVEAAASPAGRRTWQAYHLIGETLRSGQAAPARDAEAFLAKLQGRLRDERAPRPAALVVAGDLPARAPAANDWCWKMAAGVASVTAVAAIGWNVVADGGSRGEAQLATAAPIVVPVDASANAMLRDPRLDRLLAAHRQLGGATALQSTSGFLRNATFEGPAR